ncbi:MAG: BlaI/MecI/CopY family transcriptional regulator, partial [Abditibacteriota bacterium]|nr:BlaI/MecI/CopY family transcriptional regulator [Abditibacteriota bacterium]
IWREGEASAKHVAEVLKAETGWNVNTTYTLLKRCIEKGAAARSEPGFRCHNALLKRDIPLVEGLIIPAGLIGRRFTFAAFPLSIPCDSSPVRAVAIEY